MSSTSKTPFVFWEVKAVIAVAAKHPRAVTVLISACIPAPPPEPEPPPKSGSLKNFVIAISPDDFVESINQS